VVLITVTLLFCSAAHSHRKFNSHSSRERGNPMKRRRTEDAECCQSAYSYSLAEKPFDEELSHCVRPHENIRPARKTEVMVCRHSSNA